jgi:hypothetical protein
MVVRVAGSGVSLVSVGGVPSEDLDCEDDSTDEADDGRDGKGGVKPCPPGFDDSSGSPFLCTDPGDNVGGNTMCTGAWLRTSLQGKENKRIQFSLKQPSKASPTKDHMPLKCITNVELMTANGAKLINLAACNSLYAASSTEWSRGFIAGVEYSS